MGLGLPVGGVDDFTLLLGVDRERERETRLRSTDSHRGDVRHATRGSWCVSGSLYTHVLRTAESAVGLCPFLLLLFLVRLSNSRLGLGLEVWDKGKGLEILIDREADRIGKDRTACEK